MDRSKKIIRKRRVLRAAHSAAGQKIGFGWAAVRSFLCGVGVAGMILCALAMLFAKTALPLAFVMPSACCAVAVGAFSSGMSLGLALPKWRLFSGIGCGLFFALCLLLAVALAGTRPLLGETNLSLMAALLLGGTAGGAAAALCAPPSKGGR